MLATKIFFIFCLTQSAFGKTQADLSLKLMELRSQIQQEADQLESEKLRINASLQSLTVQKGELSSEKDLFQMKKKEMKKSLAEKMRASEGGDHELYKGQSEKIEESLNQLVSYFNSSVPFKLEERVSEVSKLKLKKENKELTSAEYLESYWSLLQREIRFSESVEIQKGTVEISEEKYEVEFLKVGMFGLYFKTRKGDYGHYSYHENTDSWVAEWVKDYNLTKGLSKVFLARSQGVTDGIYEMPLFIKGVSNVL